MSLFYTSLGKRKCSQFNYDTSLIIDTYSDFRDVKMWQKRVNCNRWNTGSKWPLRKSPGWGQLWNAWLSLGLSSQWDCWLRIWRTQLLCRCIFKHLDPGGKMLTPGTEAVGKDNTIRDSASSLISGPLSKPVCGITSAMYAILSCQFSQVLWSKSSHKVYIHVMRIFTLCWALCYILFTWIKSFNVHWTPI